MDEQKPLQADGGNTYPTNPTSFPTPLTTGTAVTTGGESIRRYSFVPIRLTGFVVVDDDRCSIG